MVTTYSCLFLVYYSLVIYIEYKIKFSLHKNNHAILYGIKHWSKKLKSGVFAFLVFISHFSPDIIMEQLVSLTFGNFSSDFSALQVFTKGCDCLEKTSK